MSLKWEGSQRPGKGARQRVEASWGAWGRKQLVLWFPGQRGLFVKVGGRGVGRTWRGAVLAGTEQRDWGHSAVLWKKQGKGGKTSPDTHWVAAGWPGLWYNKSGARLWGPASSPPGNPPQIGWVVSWSYKEWIFTEFGISQYFSKVMGFLGQKSDFPPAMLPILCVHSSSLKGVQGHLPAILCRMSLAKHKVPESKKFEKCKSNKVQQSKIVYWENSQSLRCANTVLKNFHKRQRVHHFLSFSSLEHRTHNNIFAHGDC
jgi:hypothetical protein